MLSLPCTSYDRILLCLFLVFLTLFWVCLSFQIHPKQTVELLTPLFSKASRTELYPSKICSVFCPFRPCAFSQKPFVFKRRSLALESPVRRPSSARLISSRLENSPWISSISEIACAIMDKKPLRCIPFIFILSTGLFGHCSV